MKVLLRPHLKLRLRERKISSEYPIKIIVSPDGKYFDMVTNHKIAVKKLRYNGKVRPMVLAYDIINGGIQAVTVYPTTDQEIKNKLKKERWKYEKD